MGYILRKVIFEDCWERQTKEIIQLCKAARIKAVLLMEQSHLTLMAPYPLAKHRRMAAIYQQMAAQLRAAGISYGINIASIVGHSDTPVPDRYVLPYQKFVGEDLQEARACYCILDPQWQLYAAQVLSIYAATNPDQIFVDDDFRSLNHGQQFGCFCPLHLAATAKRLGRAITAAEVLEAWQQPTASAKEIRQAWQEANFAGQMEAAKVMNQAVKASSETTRLGLMSSDELRHSLQGRDIGKLLRAFAGVSGRPLFRPTGALYGDGIHQSIFEGHQRMALTLEQLPEKTDIVGELELFPHTRYSSSVRISQLLMKLQTLAGAGDISLNLYDYLGNPIPQEPGWQAMLCEAGPALQKIRTVRQGKRMRGFGLPYRLTEALMQTSAEKGAVGHYPQRPLDLLLPRLGIPVQFREGRANAVLGTAISCYTDDELRRMLSGGFMTDGLGALLLQKRGLGQYLGCSVDFFGAEEIPALERIDSATYGGRYMGNYLPTNWFRYRNAGQEGPYRLRAAATAEILSEYVDLERNTLSPAMTLYSNQLGGKTVVFAGEAAPLEWGYPARAELIQNVVAVLMAGELPLVVKDCADVGPFYYEDEATKEGVVAIVNAGLDTALPRLETSLSLQPLDESRERSIAGLSIRFFQTRRD